VNPDRGRNTSLHCNPCAERNINTAMGVVEPRKNCSPKTWTAPQHRKDLPRIGAEIERGVGMDVGKQRLAVGVLVGP